MRHSFYGSVKGTLGHEWILMMLKGRKKLLWEKAEAERCAARDWLLRFIWPGQPKPATKAALREAAMAELNISKNSFDTAWIWVIEETGRHDWYKPLLRGSKPPQLG